jgi:selenocysteine lyase/cysteine desulfurase
VQPASTQGGFDGEYAFHGRFSDRDLLRWREEFPILKKAIHVAHCSISAQARSVRAALERYLENWLGVGMDWDYWCEEVVSAKAAFARIIGADTEEIAVTLAVSDAIAGIASALDYSGRRDKVVTTEAEFPTVGHIWLANRKYGCKVDYVPVRDGQVDIGEYERHIDEQTLLTSVTHVYYQNGFKQDLDAIVEIAHRKGSLVLVDGYQACGTCALDVHRQNIDIYTSGTLKYLFGLPGIAFLYVNRRLIPQLKPALTGWFGQEQPFAFKVKELEYASGTRRFDTGTPPVMTSFAARAGMELAWEIGLPGIAERIEFQSGAALREADRQGLDVASPRDVSRKGGTTAIRLRMDSHKMEKELAARNIIASARGNVIRVAPHFYTSAKEIAEVMRVIRTIIDENGAS